MNFLFNSNGNHIANFSSEQLYSPRGQNIGHFLKVGGIFIDMRGNYLGEIVHNNRLMYNISSPYKSTNFGSYGDYGNVGNYGNPGSYGSVGMIGGYRDINTPWLN